MDLFRADDKKRGGDGGGGRPTFFPKKGDPKGKKFLKDETKDEKKKDSPFAPCALPFCFFWGTTTLFSSFVVSL